MTGRRDYHHLQSAQDVERTRHAINDALDYRLKEIQYGEEAAQMEPNVEYDYGFLCRHVGGKCGPAPCDSYGTLEHDLRVLAAICGDSMLGPNYTRPILVGLIRGLAEKYGLWHERERATDADLASVLRKFVMSESAYAEWEPGSLTLDGHIGKRMTDGENEALRRLFEEKRSSR